MYRTSSICVTIAAATVGLILLTSATLTTSVYAARHHHGHRSVKDMPTNIGGHQSYGLNGPPLSDQVSSPAVSHQANGNGNNPVGKEQIQTHAPTITTSSENDMLMRFANVIQPL